MYKKLFTAASILGIVGTSLPAEEKQNYIEFRYTVDVKDQNNYDQQIREDIKTKIDAIVETKSTVINAINQGKELNAFVMQQPDFVINASISIFSDNPLYANKSAKHDPLTNKDLAYTLSAHIEKNDIDEELWKKVCEKTSKLIDYCDQAEQTKFDFNYVLEAIQNIYAIIYTQEDQEKQIQQGLNRIDFSYVITLEDATDNKSEIWQEVKNQIASIRVLDESLAATLAKLEALHNYILENRDDETKLGITGNIGCSTDAPSFADRRDAPPAPQPELDGNTETQFLHLWIEKGNLDDGTWEAICKQTCSLIDYCKETDSKEKEFKFQYVLEKIKSIYAEIGVE